MRVHAFVSFRLAMINFGLVQFFFASLTFWQQTNGQRDSGWTSESCLRRCQRQFELTMLILEDFGADGPRFNDHNKEAWECYREDIFGIGILLVVAIDNFIAFGFCAMMGLNISIMLMMADLSSHADLQVLIQICSKVILKCMYCL